MLVRVIPFLLFISTLFSQGKDNNYLSLGYYPNIYEADSLFLEKKYQDSYNLLNRTFLKFKPLQTRGYDEFETYTKLAYLLNKKDKFIENIIILIKVFGYSKEQIQKNKILSKIFLEKENFSVDEFYKKFIVNSDLELKNKILQIKQSDRLYRTSRANYNLNLIKQDSIDKENSRMLISIFDSYGFPSYRKIGVNSAYNSFDYDLTPVLIHMRDSLKRNYLLPKLLNFVQEGTCEPYTYAFVYDKYLINNNQKQFYFTVKTNDENSEEEINKINKRRKEIGIPALGSMDWRVNKKYSSDR